MGKCKLYTALALMASAGSRNFVAGEDYTAFEVKSATCQNGNTIDISMSCEENGGVCRLGDKASVYGTVNFASYPPENVHIESKACIFYVGGTPLGCYAVASLDEDLCNYMTG